MNTRLAVADTFDQGRRIAARTETVGAAAIRELASLRALPPEEFDVATLLSCKVDAKARICVRQSYYSVPARLAGARVSVALGARSFTVRDARPGLPAQVVAEHVRSLHKNTQDLILDHYLEVLARRPGALPGATALATARAAGLFTDTHERFWSAARRRHGDGPGTRVLIDVLLLHRSLPREAVLAGMDAALRLQRLDADLVAVEARRYLEPPKVINDRDAGAKEVGDRPPPRLLDYDTLLASASAPAQAVDELTLEQTA